MHEYFVIAGERSLMIRRSTYEPIDRVWASIKNAFYKGETVTIMDERNQLETFMKE